MRPRNGEASRRVDSPLSSRTASHPRQLSRRKLNRALLARQLLLRRARLPLPRALERLAGIQAQYAPSTYVRLWSSLAGFRLGDLTRALERKRVVQGTLMRSTIHAVSPRDYWLFADGVGPSRQRWWLRTHGKHAGTDDLDTATAALLAELAGRTWHRDELDGLLRAHGSTFWSGAWVALVRVPPLRRRPSSSPSSGSLALRAAP